MKRKCLAVGIILLFVAIAFSPVINARNNTIVSKPVSTSEKENTVSITLLEYKPDGTMGKSVVKLSKIQAENLRVELNNVKNLDTRLSIYKKYNLIPQNVTSETLRAGLEENAQRLELTRQKIEQIASIDRCSLLSHGNQISQKFIFINMFCNVDGDFALAILLPIGLSFFTFYILRQYEFKIFDLRDTIISLFSGIVTTNGLLPDFWSQHGFSFTKIIGFVGYLLFLDYPFPDLPGIKCLGSALYIRTFGTNIGPPDYLLNKKANRD